MAVVVTAFVLLLMVVQVGLLTIGIEESNGFYIALAIGGFIANIFTLRRLYKDAQN